jgi:hypothetical protein
MERQIVIDTAVDARSVVLERLRNDLVGPLNVDEVINERPSDRYLTGILVPAKTVIDRADDDDLNEQNAGGASEEASDVVDVPLFNSMRPSSFGLSFQAREGTVLAASLTGARYRLLEPEPEGRRLERWERLPFAYEWVVAVVEGFVSGQLGDEHDLGWSLLAKHGDDGSFRVTLTVANTASGPTGPTWIEEHSLFQAALSCRPLAGGFEARPLLGHLLEDEDRSVDLLYRSVREYSVGHNCSAAWEIGSSAETLSTDWLPSADVYSVSPNGSPEFAQWTQDGLGSASRLANDPGTFEGLTALVASYDDWIAGQTKGLDALPTGRDYRGTAERHLADCRVAAERMRAGIELISRDPTARRAFRLSNEAMSQSRGGGDESQADLTWRPFQLAFQLMNLPALADPTHEDREVMDLLWFPTGGGKTEAYLGLIGFLLFHRRLANGADLGAGVAVIMRYTLRLLTAQQLQRAAALVCACEVIRTRESDLGQLPFSIGLWIGGDGTPNTVRDAQKDPASIKIITSCPRCDGMLSNPSATELRRWCRTETCPFSKSPLPIHVVDEDVYAQRPSVLVATVDKFAQITRYRDTANLFSLEGQHLPPDLILQDELHLISGPLGTLTGLYETAIDALCSVGRPATKPKVIGSTATIRRAGAQVRSLFDRDLAQFPPAGLDFFDSGFAFVDSSAPPRSYVGITSAGRSPKFALQATMATLGQSGRYLEDAATLEAADPYWTLVTYFNSLRELGGAVVLVEDDVRRSMERLAERRGENTRVYDSPSEITSRVPTTEIPELLEQLSTSYPATDISVVLASNMISVGVDIPRLGLMVVNGQPKTTAEYIQATSRVGRGGTPGLIVVVYNAQRPRDRSRYESFRTWHAALYRDVEATSVTPFAPRARDRALHAPLVALMRLVYPEGNDSPRLTQARMSAVREVVGLINARAARVDPEEAAATAEQLARLTDDWRLKSSIISDWWWTRRAKAALLIGAEDQAALVTRDWVTDAWPTPNSMREVEPSVRVGYVPGLRSPETEKSS